VGKALKTIKTGAGYAKEIIEYIDAISKSIGS